jgi:hypothetical protein
MSFIRKIKKNDHIYYAEVENERVNGKVVQRHIRYIGKDPNAPKNRFGLTQMNLRNILERLSSGSLTPDDIFDILEKSGEIITRGKLKKMGIEYDFPKKTISIFLRYQK